MVLLILSWAQLQLKSEPEPLIETSSCKQKFMVYAHSSNEVYFYMIKTRANIYTVLSCARNHSKRYT